jgi:hypothetical protein
MAPVTLILMVLAFVLFLVASAGVASGRINLIAAGLACWVLALILGGIR